jgi:serine/threonine protein kinase
MPDEKWQKVREVFDSALRRKPEERRKFVREACGGDEILEAEVESLLASHDSADSFLETPAVARVAGEILPKQAQFASGRRLGHYSIREQIGAGGMGEVYLARDEKLQRPVALKVVRQNLLLDKAANHRLLREARAAALLDHPHICQIYEISENADCGFIVMQYIVGKTLAEILKRERLSVEKSLDLAVQIADALAHAHSRGVIHRDIKPANVMVNDRGAAKVLDFGLAKFIEIERNAETVQRLNSSGAVMGTVPFMSPEQLRCQRLDARTDVFSFGSLFYEMLAGRQPFARENNAETISAILNDEPDWSPIPAKIQRILRKSLAKNKDSRYESALDLAEDLRALQKSGVFNELSQVGSTSPNERAITNEPTHTKKRQFYFWQSGNENSRAALGGADAKGKQTGETKPARAVSFIAPFVLTIIALIVATALFYWQFKKADDDNNFDALRPARLVAWKSGAGQEYGDYRVSNDGKMIAFSSTQNGTNESIYVKQTADSEEIRVTKDEWNNHSPLWSPDDQRIAFASVREGKSGIYVSPPLGGAATALKIIGAGDLSLRHWAANGAAIFYELDGNLFRLDLPTGEIARITDFARSPQNGRHFEISPDEKRVAFLDERDAQIDLWMMSLADSGAAFRLTNDADRETRPLWHADGNRILYNVMRQSDVQINLAYADGRAAPVQVTRGDGDYEMVDISRDGTKIFYMSWQKRSDIGGVEVETGEEFDFASEAEAELWAAPAPDGKSIVYQTNAAPRLTPNLSDSTLVVKSLVNQSPPLVLKGYSPRWLPDSRRIAFFRWHKAEQKYQYWLFDTASGEEKQLTIDGINSPSISLMPINRYDAGNNWSPDAKRFVYLDSKRQNVLSASVETSEISNLTNNADPNLRFYAPQFSPDGKRVAFLSVHKTRNPKSSVWLNEEGKSKEIFSTEATLLLLGWTAGGDKILFAMIDGALRTMPLNVRLLEISAAGGNRIVNVLQNAYVSSITLSADGKTLAFIARNDDKDDVWTASASGGEAKKLTANISTRLFFGSPAWTSDGKIIFFDKQDQINTISVFENFK